MDEKSNETRTVLISLTDAEADAVLFVLQTQRREFEVRYSGLTMRTLGRARAKFHAALWKLRETQS